MKQFVCLLALLALASWPAHAQFIGYTSPQTVQQTLATNLACTGAAQTFVVQNLGQTQHYLSVAQVTNATSFSAEIDGIDRQGNTYLISDVLQRPSAGSSPSNGNVAASGYFPKVQVSITCSPITATFSASYSGASATFNQNVGSYLAAELDKSIFSGLPQNTTANAPTFQTPFGVSAGTLTFQYGTAGAPGNTVQVTCTGSPTLTFTLDSITAVQTFEVPNRSCTFVTISYQSSGSGGANTFGLGYLFAPPGLASFSAWDPCQSGQFLKITLAVSAAAAGTTRIVTALTGTQTYVCGYQISQAATAGTVRFVYGTGANCGTGTTNISGAMSMTAGQAITYGNGGAVVFAPPQDQDLCITATGAGGTVDGLITVIRIAGSGS